MNTPQSSSTEEHVALAADLVSLVEHRLLDPLEIVTDSRESVAPLRLKVRADAEMWAAQLLGSDAALATSTGSRLLAALFGGGDAFSPPSQWWRTPFGRVIARRLGYPGRDGLSGAEAASQLGISRQGVHDLLRRGKLDRTSQGQVSVASVQARLRAAQ